MTSLRDVGRSLKARSATRCRQANIWLAIIVCCIGCTKEKWGERCSLEFYL
jgi:hypothetical protein